MTPQRILHVVQTLDPSFGGPARVAFELASAQAAEGHAVRVIAARSANMSLADDFPGPTPNLSFVELPVSFGPLLYCRRLLRTLLRDVRQADVVHVHGAYRFPPTLAAWMSLVCGRPLVTRPHGTYDEVLRSLARKNGVARSIWEQVLEFPILRSPRTVVHCTSEQERLDLLRVVPRASNISVTPIAVTAAPSRTVDGAMRARLGIPDDSVLFLYLGRITPKKRLDLLLNAFRQLDVTCGAYLVIAGADTDGLRRQLEGHDEHVRWIGHVNGDEREEAFAAADVFVLTSGGENFGVAAVEAAARGLPLLLTEQVASASILRSDACITVSLCVDEIATKLWELATTDRAALRALGAEARRVWEQRLSWERVVPDILRIYHDAELAVRAHR